MGTASILRRCCLALSIAALVAGGFGMLVGLLRLAAPASTVAMTGAPIALAAAVLIAAGLVSLTRLATTRPVKSGV